MLNRLQTDAPPPAGALQLKVDELATLLATPPISSKPAAARRAWSEARDTADAARAALLEIVKRHPSNDTERREIEAARAASVRADAAARGAGAAYQAAKDKAGEEFLAYALQRIDRAAPTLVEVAELISETITPLVDLHTFGWRHQYPMPMFLQHVPEIQRGLQHLIAALNHVTAPRNGSGH